MAVKYYGLCESCEHDETCTLRRSSRLKIVQCEDFSMRIIENRILQESGDSEIEDPAYAAHPGISAKTH